MNPFEEVLSPEEFQRRVQHLKDKMSKLGCMMDEDVKAVRAKIRQIKEMKGWA